jgi:hypothetical protein
VYSLFLVTSKASILGSILDFISNLGRTLLNVGIIPDTLWRN